MAATYQNATTKLYSDVVRLLETVTELNPRQLSFTMQKVDEEIQIGFAMSANLQAKSVTLTNELVVTLGCSTSGYIVWSAGGFIPLCRRRDFAG